MGPSRRLALACVVAALLAVVPAAAPAARAAPGVPPPPLGPPTSGSPTTTTPGQPSGGSAPTPGTTTPAQPPGASAPAGSAPSLGSSAPPRSRGRCDGLPFPVRAGCQVGTATLAAVNPTTLVFKALTVLLADTAAWLLRQVGANITATTTPELGLPWFTNSYAATLTVGLLLVAMFTFLAVIQCLLRGAGAELGRIALLYVPGAIVLMFLAPTLTTLLLHLMDEFTDLVAHGNRAAVTAAIAKVIGVLGTLTATTPPGANSLPTGAGQVMALLVALGAVVVWLELLLRNAAVYAVELFVPLGLAAMVWPAIRHWCRRIIEVLVAVAAAKFFIVTIVVLSANGLAARDPGDATSILGTCVALLVLAAFTPVALLKLIPIAGAELSGGLHMRGSLSQAAAAVGATEVSGAARSALMSNVRGAAAGRGPAAAAAAMPGAGPAPPPPPPPILPPPPQERT